MIDPKTQQLYDRVIEAIKVFDDPNFDFVEEWHQYTYKGVKMQSSTQYNKQFQVPFDFEYQAKKYGLKHGIPVTQVKDDWAKKAQDGRDSGDAIHKYIEDLHTLDTAPLNPVVREDIQERVDLSIQQFHTWADEFLRDFFPVAFELKVFDPSKMIAGMIDSLWIWRQWLFILDWKGNKKITTDDDFAFDYLKPPFNPMPQNDINNYSMQQSFYTYIFTKMTGIPIKKCYIVNITPEHCIAYACKDLTTDYYELFK